MQLEPEGAHVVQFESRNNPRRCQSFVPRGGGGGLNNLIARGHVRVTIYIIYNNRENATLKSQVWGLLTLAQL